MPKDIVATLYRAKDHKWQSRGSSDASLGTAAAFHAERAVYDAKAGVDDPILIVQNAYPCTTCHNYFISKSQFGKNVIIKVTKDQGAYGAEHGFTLNRAPVPAIIYYRAGAAKIVHMTAADRNPLAGFPAVPDFDYL